MEYYSSRKKMIPYYLSGSGILVEKIEASEVRHMGQGGRIESKILYPAFMLVGTL